MVTLTKIMLIDIPFLNLRKHGAKDMVTIRKGLFRWRKQPSYGKKKPFHVLESYQLEIGLICFLVFFTLAYIISPEIIICASRVPF